MARNVRSVSDLVVGGYLTADPRGAGTGLLPPVRRPFSGRALAGRSSAGRGAETVAGTRLLQPRAEPAYRSERHHGAFRRPVSGGLRGGAFAVRGGGLYRCRDLFVRLRAALCGGRRQCLSGAFPRVRRGFAGGRCGGQTLLRRIGAVVARSGTSGPAEPGYDGVRSSAMRAAASRLRGVSAGRPLSGAGARHGWPGVR